MQILHNISQMWNYGLYAFIDFITYYHLFLCIVYFLSIFIDILKRPNVDLETQLMISHLRLFETLTFIGTELLIRVTDTIGTMLVIIGLTIVSIYRVYFICKLAHNRRLCNFHNFLGYLLIGRIYATLKDMNTNRYLSQEITCAVCREDVTNERVLPCGHLFHNNCIERWEVHSRTCPTCRERF